ncbi:MAG: hydrogenase maturation nickel metallochaperone HypA [Anaerolineae bacterium]|nr:hydrogenase maturation nickel metallochaperone HypA [Anaerolineae bacterium]
MHELAVTEEVLRVVLNETERVGADRVAAVDLALGELSPVVRESVEFFWQFVTRGTPAERALLRFRSVPALARCRGCGRVYRPQSRDFRCPGCGEVFADVLEGEEFRVESIEVE